MSYSYSVCYCYECTKLNLNDQNRYDPEKYYCTEYNRYINKCDHACSNHFVYNEALKRSSCFITTAVCEILGLSDDNIYLTSLRNFRDNYMMQSEELKKILVEYDLVGPIISICIKNDTFKRTKSLMMLELYIKPIYNLLNNKKYSEAIDRYIDMTHELMISYNIKRPTYDIDQIDTENIGRGHKIKIKEA